MFLLNRNKKKTNPNSLIGSIFWYFFRKIFRFFWFALVCFEIVCFGCFASITKQSFDVLIEHKQTEDNQNSLIESIFCNFLMKI
jgi:hypothetical protein